jgi:hypothetical protein
MMASPAIQGACGCGDDDPAGCVYVNAGYAWCGPCGEHHRPPACPSTPGEVIAP